MSNKLSFSNIKIFFCNEQDRFGFLNSRGLLKYIPDERFLKKKFRLAMGYDLDLENPQTFNEKLQWLKLYNRKPEYTKKSGMTVRLFMAKVILFLTIRIMNFGRQACLLS